MQLFASLLDKLCLKNEERDEKDSHKSPEDLALISQELLYFMSRASSIAELPNNVFQKILQKYCEFLESTVSQKAWGDFYWSGKYKLPSVYNKEVRIYSTSYNILYVHIRICMYSIQCTDVHIYILLLMKTYGLKCSIPKI